eukprot:2831435-Amphidinium_carterae.1
MCLLPRHAGEAVRRRDGKETLLLADLTVLKSAAVTLFCEEQKRPRQQKTLSCRLYCCVPFVGVWSCMVCRENSDAYIFSALAVVFY